MPTFSHSSDRLRFRRASHHTGESHACKRLVHFLHFRAGFHQRLPAYITWGVIVDLVVLSIVLWVVSGIYLWARMRRVRVSGAICLGTGMALFLLLVILLCR
ncbi:MAG: hypothetical protein ACC645_00715 [Pirellulales bacterium]